MNSELNISLERLSSYVRMSFGSNQLIIGDWSYSRLAWKALNDVTGGLYRFGGIAYENDKIVHWTLIVKVVMPSQNANDPNHYNYWKREVLAYQSGLLDTLPNMIRAPRLFGVEEQNDGTVWLWLEEIKDCLQGKWTIKQYEQTARMLGGFNGTYLVGKDLPSAFWLCRDWLSSWVEECNKYDDGTTLYEDTWANPFIKEFFPSNIFERYVGFHRRRGELLNRLRRLPRVLTHNDAWVPNLFHQEDGTIVAIDWAFVGIAAIGQELGRFYGLCLHSDLDPTIDVVELENVLFEAYCQGLGEVGWDGDLKLARFGFSASAGIRCGMVIPKLVKQASNRNLNEVDVFQKRCKNALQLLKLSEEALNQKFG